MTRLSRRAFTASILGAAATAARAGATPSAQTPGRPAEPSTAASGALAALTLADASARIRAGTVTSTDLVNACLARIDVYNPKVNAFITVTATRALAHAKALDAEQRAGKLRGPLHGIPIALKDNIDTAGRAHHRRERGVRRSRPGRGCRGRAPPCRGRRRHRRQSEPARVRVRRHVGDELLRAGAQPVGARTQSRRVVGRIGRGGRDRSLLRRARHRHRRIDPHAGVLLQHRRTQAHLRPGVHPRHHSADGLARPLRPDDPDRHGRRDAC